MNEMKRSSFHFYNHSWQKIRNFILPKFYTNFYCIILRLLYCLIVCGDPKEYFWISYLKLTLWKSFNFIVKDILWFEKNIRWHLLAFQYRKLSVAHLEINSLSFSRLRYLNKIFEICWKFEKVEVSNEPIEWPRMWM